ncbi:MAG: hypothetical protein ABI581_16865 [Sediminibacterium sp.]
MKYFNPIAIAFLVFLSCKSQVKNDADQSIYELNIFKRVDTLKTGDTISLHQTRYYVVDKSIKEKNRDTLIKRFVENFTNDVSDSLVALDLMFYKESDITNRQHLESNPRDLDRFSQDNDLVWDFYVNKHKKLFWSFKYKAGKIIEPTGQPAITITDTKPKN